MQMLKKPDVSFDIEDLEELSKAIASSAIMISEAWQQIIIATLLLSFVIVVGTGALVIRNHLLLLNVLEEVEEEDIIRRYKLGD